MSKFNHVKISLSFFLLVYFFLLLLLSIITYNFFIDDFVKLEKNKNFNNIHTLVKAMDTNLQNIKNSANDFSKWDETFDFINNTNKNYLYDNFREGTSTLEDLDVDFILFSNLKNQVIFSKYSGKVKELVKDKVKFEENIYINLRKTLAQSTIFKYKSYVFYLIKSEILRSDKTGNVSGHIYSGKVIKNEDLSRITKVFKRISITQKHNNEYDLSLALEHLKKIEIKVTLDSKSINNNIQFYDERNRYIFSILTTSDIQIINNGKKTILSFNLILAILLFIICYFIYKNQNILEEYNIKLERKVSKRTELLSLTLRQLKGKNEELFTLANTDTLTKIRNRRNYFKESEKALKEVTSSHGDLCVLMIDIDHFKEINDTYGHSSGDRVLIEFCSIINSIIDETAIFGRIGGEEFCITFVHKTLKETTAISEKIRKACENCKIQVGEETISFTISLGLNTKAKHKTIDQILQVSDELLYKAKHSGRNRLIRTSIH